MGRRSAGGTNVMGIKVLYATIVMFAAYKIVSGVMLNKSKLSLQSHSNGLIAATTADAESAIGDVLKHKCDRYDGVIIDSNGLPESKTDFKLQLKKSLNVWKKANNKGIWLKIPIEKSSFIPVAVKLNFEFHHAEKDYCMLTIWLSPSPNQLPPNASTQVGVGAIVLNPNNKSQILTVKERNGLLKGTGFNKIPTGLLLQGEEIDEGVVREVKEETGIDTNFIGVVGFRHAHDALFTKSDIFFICFLEGISDAISIQESEIESSQWMNIDEYLAQPLFQNSPSYQRMQSIIKNAIDDHTKISVTDTNTSANTDKSSHARSIIVKESLSIGWKNGCQSIYSTSTSIGTTHI